MPFSHILKTVLNWIQNKLRGKVAKLSIQDAPNIHITALNVHEDYNMLEWSIVLSIIFTSSILIVILWKYLFRKSFYDPEPTFLEPDDIFDLGNVTDELQRVRIVLKTRLKDYGEAHKATANALYTLGILLQRKGHLDKAERLLRSAMAVFENESEGKSPEMFRIVNSLAVLLCNRDPRSVEGWSLLRRAFEGQIQALGWGSIETQETMRNIALVLDATGRTEESIEIFTTLLSLQKDPTYGSEIKSSNSVVGYNLPLLRTCVSLADRRQALDIVKAAKSNRNSLNAIRLLYQEAVDGYIAILGETHADTLTVMHRLGALLFRLQDFDEAEK
jgi:tetratricopeptide (TPR) repeat protein